MDFVLRHNSLVRRTTHYLKEAGQESIGKALDSTSGKFAFEARVDGKIVTLFVINHRRKRLDVYPSAKILNTDLYLKIRNLYTSWGYSLSPAT